MKAGILKLLLILIGFYSISSYACPCCVGRSQRGTPAFFEDELYETGGNTHEQTVTFLSDAKSYKLDIVLSKLPQQ